MSSMIYQYICVFNWFSKIFGINYPFPDSLGNTRRVTYINKLWSFLVFVLLVTSYAFSVKTVDFNIKSNLYLICQTNDILVATTSLLVNSFENKEVRVNLYETVNIILNNLKISSVTLKIFCLKFLLRVLAPFIMYFLCLILEIMTTEPPFYQLFTRIPILISFTHLLIHYWLMVAAMDAVNRKLTKKLTVMKRNEEGDMIDECLHPERGKKGIFKYLLNPNVNFFEVEVSENVDIKLICRIYDELCTCVRLLEMHHGYQAILMVWLIFSNTVCIATSLICQQAENQLMLALISVLPFYCAFILANVDRQMSCMVETLDNLVVKLLIEFQCDQSRKNILQVLKQQVATNRLQFVACGVLCLNYSTLLNIVMNIITYTIILVQVLLRVD